MTINDQISEHDIAIAAAVVLRERFINVASTETVLYIENDILLRKEPNKKPVFVKKLEERNPQLARHVFAKRVFKIKKRSI